MAQAKTARPQEGEVPVDRVLADLGEVSGLPGQDTEPAFRAWYAERAKALGLDPNPDDPRHFYDYRAAFRAGAEPDEKGHWPSQFKRAGHPRMVVDGVNTKTGARAEPVAARNTRTGAMRTLPKKVPKNEVPVADVVAEFDPIPLGEVAKQMGSNLVAGVAEIPAGLAHGVGIGAEAVGGAFGKDWSAAEREGRAYAEAIRDASKAIRAKPIPGHENDFFLNAFPQALGSSLGFAGVGLAAQAVKIPRLLALLGAGFQVGGAAQYEDARLHGAPLSDRWKAYVLGGGVGMVDAIPMERFLSRVDTASGGALTRALVDATLEGGTEGGQQVANNIIAAHILKYDKDREYLEGLMENAGAGGLAGLFGGAIATAEANRRAEKQTKARIEESLGRADQRAMRQPRAGLGPEPTRVELPQEGKSIADVSREGAEGGAAILGFPEERHGAAELGRGPIQHEAEFRRTFEEQSAAAGPREGAAVLGRPGRSDEGGDFLGGPPEEGGGPDEVERRVDEMLGGKTIPIEELTPEVIQRAVEKKHGPPPRAEIAPGAAEQAPSAGQPAATEAVSEPAGTAGAPGAFTGRLREIQNELSEIGDRLGDKDNPPSEEEKAQLRARAAELDREAAPLYAEHERRVGKLEPTPERQRTADVVQALREVLDQYDNTKVGEEEEDLQGAIQRAQRVIDSRRRAGRATTELDAALAEVVDATNLDLTLPEEHEKEKAQSEYLRAALKRAAVVLEAMEQARTETKLPEGVPKDGPAVLPAWLREGMERSGRNPSRIFNDFDMDRPGMKEMLANDPVVLWLEKTDPKLAERAKRGDITAAEYTKAADAFRQSQTEQPGPAARETPAGEPAQGGRGPRQPAPAAPKIEGPKSGADLVTSNGERAVVWTAGDAGYVLVDETDDAVTGLQVVVDPKRRRQGIGRALHEAAFAYAKSKGKAFRSGDVVGDASERNAERLYWESLEREGRARKIGPQQWEIPAPKRGLHSEEAKAKRAERAAGPATKEDEEQREATEVKGARILVETARREGLTEHEVFDELVTRYERMPRLKSRTSTSKELQAYSTPTPLAWVASQLAGIDENTTVFEPTAGNGALLIGANPANVTANELDPRRAEALRAQGFDPSQVDAAISTNFSGVKADAVIANPPFGKVQDDKGGHRTFAATVGHGHAWNYITKELDHAIALSSLLTMKDDGRAVLILGGHKPFGDPSQEARTKKYGALTQQQFWKALYGTYNVVDHFTIAGKLYDRMGAAWPIDVVVIHGRGQSSLTPPYTEAPRILETWNDVRALLPGERLASGRKPEADRGPAGEGQRGVEGELPRPARGATGEVAGRPREREGGARAGERVVGERPGARPAGEPSGERVAGVLGGEAGAVGRGGPQRVAEEGESVAGGEQGAAGNRPSRMAAASAAAPTRGLERVGEFQATYRPKSKAPSVGTLVPANMQLAMDRALARVGDPDSFVAKKLGYKKGELANHFSAEQIDALALAIQNLDNKAGFVIGDQTGVGKGRVVAGVLRYARRLGKIPVFVTAKPGLYADMKRDLADIGEPDFTPFVTNTNLRGADKIPLGEGGYLESLPKAEHEKTMAAIASSGKLPRGIDAIFTTYDQQNPKAGERTLRSTWLARLAPNAILVLDESHLAGGTEASGFMVKEGEQVQKATRSEFFREIVDAADGVVYSSATYAKNPHVMTLYTRTDLGLAADRAKLPELVRLGGVPLQQAIASQLVEQGQYVRREKSFEGISMEMDVAETNRAPAERAAELLRALFTFDIGMTELRDNFIRKNAKAGGGVNAGDSSVGEGGGKSGGFSSVMHNVVSQMLLSLKAREVGRKAVLVSRGELVRADGTKVPASKPVIALSNTLEGLLEDVAADAESETGDTISDFTFAKVFERYLERMRQVTIKRPFSKDKGEKVRISDEDMGGLLGEWEALKEQIAATDLGDMPASPIDAIIHEMEKGGLKVGEITGREVRVEYQDDGDAVLAERKSSDAEKKKAMTDFNGGLLDALVINQSGSTGYSLHASPKNGKTLESGAFVADERPRHMFVVQADPNIDVFMQMLGRINRTGQTSLPSYTVLVSDLPAEKRPAAILMRKMASLNANTSASRKSAVSLKNVTDFMNVYGDEATADVLRGEPEIAEAIGFDDDRIDLELERENLARRATGLLPMLPIDEQHRILEAIESNYAARLEEADARGENLLEAKALDLKAKTLSEAVLVPGKPGSSFTEPAMLQEIEASRTTKPLTWAEIQARARRLAEAGDRAALEKKVDDALNEARAKAAKEYQELEKRIAEDPAKAEKLKVRQDAIKARFTKAALNADAIKSRLRLEGAISLETDEGATPAYLVGFETRGNALAPSNWTLHVAPVGGEGVARIPISRLMSKSRGDPGFIALERANRSVGAEDFSGKASETREKRWMVTGNLLAGFQKMGGRGQIVFYTDEKGAQHQGILMKRGMDPRKVVDAQPVRMNAAQAIKFLDSKYGGFVEDSEGAFRLASRGGGEPIVLTAMTRGGKPYYLHKEARRILGKDYASARGQREYQLVTSDREALRRALEVYERDLGMALQATTQKDVARAITGEKLPEMKGKEGADVPAEQHPDEFLAFPGSIIPDVKAAADYVAEKLGYRRNQRATVAGTIPTEALIEHQIRKYVDAFRGGKTLIQHVQKLGGEVTDDIDFYLQEELRRRRTQNRLEAYRAEDKKPILAGLRADGISEEEAGEVAMARAAPDRNRITIGRDAEVVALGKEIHALASSQPEGAPTAKFKKKMAELQAARDARIEELASAGFGSGYTDEEANAIVERALSGKRAAGFRRFFERFDRMIQKTQDGWVRDGLMSQEEVDALREAQPFYAPMRSDLSEEDNTPFKGTGKGVDVRGREFKAALGRYSKANPRHVLAYAFIQAEMAIVRGEKEHVARSFLNFLRAHAELLKGFAKIGPAQTKRALVNGVVRDVYDPKFRLADNVFQVKENGQAIWIEIDPKFQNVADGLKNLGTQDLGSAVELMSRFTRYLGGMVTRYAPYFPLRNAIRDARGAFITGQEIGPDFANAILRDLPKAYGALTRQKRGKAGKDAETAKWLQRANEFRDNGGPVAFVDMHSFEDTLRAIARDTRAEMKGGAIGSTWRGMRHFLDLVGDVNDVIENGVRFSAYYHLIERGWSPERAASYAKNLTVNFERKGQKGGLWNALYMFAGAHVQSLARIGQAVRHPAVRRVIYAGFLANIFLDQANRLIGGKDDDDEDYYDKIPPYIRRHNTIIMLPEGVDIPGALLPFVSEVPDGGGRYLKIPAPFIYSWFATAAQQLSGAMSGDIKPGDALGEMMAAAFNSFDPIGTEGGVLQAISPTATDVVVQIATNRDWKNDPIRYDTFNEGKPESATAWPEPSVVSKGAAEWLNKVTGGDEFTPGMIDIAPQNMDHFVEFLTGGFGRFLSDMHTAAVKLGEGQKLAPHEVPFMSSFVGDPSPFQSTEDFHKLQEFIRDERDRAIRDKKLLTPALGGLWKEGNQLEQYRQRQRKVIDSLEGESKRIAQRELDRQLQRWNKRAREALLTE